MTRPLAEADELIDRISKKYAVKYYEDMAKRQRGISIVMNFNVNNILLEDLRQNEMIPGLLTAQERDNIINELI